MICLDMRCSWHHPDLDMGILSVKSCRRQKVHVFWCFGMVFVIVGSMDQQDLSWSDFSNNTGRLDIVVEPR
jgi:hypothetical protein